MTDAGFYKPKNTASPTCNRILSDIQLMVIEKDWEGLKAALISNSENSVLFFIGELMRQMKEIERLLHRTPVPSNEFSEICTGDMRDETTI